MKKQNTQKGNIRNKVKYVCAYSRIFQLHIRLMDYNINADKANLADYWNKMITHVRIRVQGFGSIYNSGSDGYYLYKKFSTLYPKE